MKVNVENAVCIGSYITVVVNGKVVREYLTPKKGQYVKYWDGEGPSCIGLQEFGAGKISSSGWAAAARTWPSDDKETCAKWLAKLWRVRYLGHSVTAR